MSHCSITSTGITYYRVIIVFFFNHISIGKGENICKEMTAFTEAFKINGDFIVVSDIEEFTKNLDSIEEIVRLVSN
ncbi:hypothetical protein [Candidatus Lokiarchaeum ossiferum]